MRPVACGQNGGDVPRKSATMRTTKPTLDREVFVDAALRLASRQHTVALTYREIGEDLGVDPTAIYRHFPSKEALMQELLDRLFKIACEKVETPRTDWDACLLEFAQATLTTFLEYPAVAVTATSLTTSGNGELDSIELMLACFAESGLTGKALAEQYAVFGSYVLAGAAGLARDLAESSTPESHKWFAGPWRADPARSPRATALRDEILALDHRTVFLAGVAQIVYAGGSGHHAAMPHHGA